MMFKLEKVDGHNIYHFRFEECHWLAWAFLRIQEFYESTDDTIRGFYHPLDVFLERELRERGQITYTEDWGGFNVPGHIWQYFFAKYSHELRQREKDMQAALAEMQPEGLFYVIGTPEDHHSEETFEHEIRHALWYLYDDYRREMLEAMKRFPTHSLRQSIKEEDYDDSVLDDEVQAYVLTGLYDGMKETKEVGKLRDALKKVEKKFWPYVKSV